MYKQADLTAEDALNLVLSWGLEAFRFGVSGYGSSPKAWIQGSGLCGILGFTRSSRGGLNLPRLDCPSVSAETLTTIPLGAGLTAGAEDWAMLTGGIGFLLYWFP